MYSTGNIVKYMVMTLYSDRYKSIKLYKTSTLQKAFLLNSFLLLVQAHSWHLYLHIYLFFKIMFWLYRYQNRIEIQRNMEAEDE